MMARVSIVVPLYNREKFIEAAMSSVVQQTMPDWQLVVVDDGSTDLGPEKVRAFAAKDPRIELYFRTGEPKGGNACRNIGLGKAKGDFVIFLDSDDLLQPDCLAGRVRLMQEHPGLDFAVLPGLTFDSDQVKPRYHWNLPRKEPDLHRFLQLDSPWQTTGPIWRKSFLDRHQLLWDEGLALWQDVDFHIRALALEPTYTVFWELPADYLVRQDSPDSMSRTAYYGRDKAAARISFFYKHAGYFSQQLQALKALGNVYLVALKSAARTGNRKHLFKLVKEGRRYGLITPSEYFYLYWEAGLARILPDAVFPFPSGRTRKRLVIEREPTLQTKIYTGREA